MPDMLTVSILPKQVSSASSDKHHMACNALHAGICFEPACMRQIPKMRLVYATMAAGWQGAGQHACRALGILSGLKRRGPPDNRLVQGVRVAWSAHALVSPQLRNRLHAHPASCWGACVHEDMSCLLCDQPCSSSSHR